MVTTRRGERLCPASKQAGECIGEYAGARDLSVCLVPGLVLAGIGAGGAIGAADANGVRVIILGGRSLRGDDRLHPVAWPPSPYSRTGAARHDDDRPQHAEPPAAVLGPQDLRVWGEQLHRPANGEGLHHAADRRSRKH